MAAGSVWTSCQHSDLRGERSTSVRNQWSTRQQVHTSDPDERLVPDLQPLPCRNVLRQAHHHLIVSIAQDHRASPVTILLEDCRDDSRHPLDPRAPLCSCSRDGYLDLQYLPDYCRLRDLHILSDMKQSGHQTTLIDTT